MVYNSCPAIRTYSRILSPFCRHLASSFLVLSSEKLIILSLQLGLKKRICRRGSRRNPFQDFQEEQDGCSLEISTLNRFRLVGEDFRIDALPSRGIEQVATLNATCTHNRLSLLSKPCLPFSGDLTINPMVGSLNGPLIH